MSKFLIFFIFIYQKSISPFLGRNCRFSPSCSCYAKECLENFPVHKALWYSLVRILKCHPFHSGGYDPVPLSIVNKDSSGCSSHLKEII